MTYRGSSLAQKALTDVSREETAIPPQQEAAFCLRSSIVSDDPRWEGYVVQLIHQQCQLCDQPR